MKRMGMTLTAALVAVAAAGCGGDDEEALSKSEYVKRANEICTTGNNEIEKQAEEQFGSQRPSDQEIEEFATDVAIPSIEDQVSELRDLPAPEGDEDTVAEIYDSADEALEQAKDDPGVFAGDQDPFEETNRLAEEYGLEECAG